MLALKGLQSGKAPGPDGLSSEFYREFQDVLIDPFLEMFEHSFITGSLPHSLREADITLILKKGKCGSEKPFLNREDQTGFIKGRSSSHNVGRLLHIINICQTHENDSMVISLDAEKAAEWSYLFNVLHKFNLGDNLHHG